MPAPFSSQNTAVVPGAASTKYSTPSANPHYQVRLEVRGGDQALTRTGGKIFPIIAFLPERYNIDFSSQWSSPFSRTDIASAVGAAAGKFGGIAQAITQGAFNIAGISTKLKAQSVQVWDSTSPMAFSIQMVFNAEENAATDVRDKHRALLKLCAPSEGTAGILTQPGPTIASATGSAIGISGDSRQIDLYIGSYLRLQNVIVTNVSSDISTLCDASGIPINMTIGLTVESFFSCFTSEDIDKMFGA